MSNTLDIIIVGKNEQENLSRCIQSAKLAANRAEENIKIKSRIIYVDSNSTDQSKEVARKNGIEIFDANPDFQGSSNGRMSGITLTHGTFVMFLDGDCELHPDWILKGIHFLLANKKTGGISGDISFNRRIGNKTIQIDVYGTKSDKIENYKSKFYFTGNVLVRRSALSDFGGHEPDLTRFGDIYFLCELLANGWQVYKLPIPMCLHWDTSFRNFIAGIQKFFIFVSGSARRGALLHYAKTRGTQKYLLPYYKWELIQLAFLISMATIIALFLTISSHHLELGIITFILIIWYLAYNISRKKNLIFGLLAVPLLTAYVFAVSYGILFNRPIIRWGVQRSEKYRQTVYAANNIE